jgi:hypothetical protein
VNKDEVREKMQGVVRGRSFSGNVLFETTDILLRE